MSRASNGIATEKDIKWGIDNNILMLRLLAAEYTDKAVTKGRLSSFIYYDESLVSGLTDNQLVKWELLEPTFITNYIGGSKFSENGGTFNYKISSKYGWTASKSVSWITSVTPTFGSSGVTSFSFTLSKKTTTGDRTGTIKFTETTTNAEIELTITQKGTVAPQYQSILLRRNLLESDACSTIPNQEFYFIEYNKSLLNTSGIWLDNNGTNYANEGYYSDGLVWRHWTGSYWTVSGFCTP